MITQGELAEARRDAAARIRRAGLRITDPEAQSIEVVDFGLGKLREEGVQVWTMTVTDRLALKVLVLFPHQTEPEHWHPPVGSDPGKEETVRVLDGLVRFYVPGPATFATGRIPPGKERHYSARHEHVLRPGDQLTLPPGTRHWFQAAEDGAVMLSISTTVRDGLDAFSDPDVRRETVIVPDRQK